MKYIMPTLAFVLGALIYPGTEIGAIFTAAFLLMGWDDLRKRETK